MSTKIAVVLLLVLCCGCVHYPLPKPEPLKHTDRCVIGSIVTSDSTTTVILFCKVGGGGVNE